MNDYTIVVKGDPVVWTGYAESEEEAIELAIAFAKQEGIWDWDSITALTTEEENES